MAKRKKSSVKNSPRWRQSNASYRRRTGKAGRHVGVGRYLLGFMAVAVMFYFVGSTVSTHVRKHLIFTVREVVVEGVEYLDDDALLTEAAVEPGVNIFDVDIAEVAGRIKRAFEAENFTVYRSMPNRITIRVNERHPVALLNMKTLVGVDKNGVPLPHIGADLVTQLPIISGIGTIAGLSDSTVHARLTKGLELLKEIEKQAPATYNRISEINVAQLNTMGISLVDNGLEVIIGDRDWARKVPLIDRVVNEITVRRGAVKAVDIRFGEIVVVKK